MYSPLGILIWYLASRGYVDTILTSIFAICATSSPDMDAVISYIPRNLQHHISKLLVSMNLLISLMKEGRNCTSFVQRKMRKRLSYQKSQWKGKEKSRNS